MALEKQFKTAAELEAWVTKECARIREGKPSGVKRPEARRDVEKLEK